MLSTLTKLLPNLNPDVVKIFGICYIVTLVAVLMVIFVLSVCSALSNDPAQRKHSAKVLQMLLDFIRDVITTLFGKK